MSNPVRAWVKRRGIVSTSIAGVAAAGGVALTIGWLIGSGAASAGGSPGWTTYSDRGHQLTVSFPSAWHRARTRLVPQLSDPREILSLGTGHLQVGSGGDCGRYPAKAMAAMGRGDVLISIQEGFAPPGAKWLAELPRRPSHFQIRSPGPGFEKVSRRFAFLPRFSKDGSILEFNFRARDRAFWVLLAMGGSVQPKVREAALSVLDSLRFGPTTSR